MSCRNECESCVSDFAWAEMMWAQRQILSVLEGLAIRVGGNAETQLAPKINSAKVKAEQIESEFRNDFADCMNGLPDDPVSLQGGSGGDPLAFSLDDLKELWPIIQFLLEMWKNRRR